MIVVTTRKDDYWKSAGKNNSLIMKEENDEKAKNGARWRIGESMLHHGEIPQTAGWITVTQPGKKKEIQSPRRLL